ncbi:MAG TPA: methyltransferase domain-containing protein [Candidatus Dormibacteraeota bacterium]
MSFETGTEMYARFVGRYTGALAEALVDRAGVRQGDSALDVGCGPGAALETLARRVGAENVAGIDPSKPFVEMAMSRVPGADVRLGAAEALPFDDRSFDVVLSQLVINFMRDARAGVSEMHRTARRTVASCVWDYAGEMTMLRTFWDAARELDPDAPDERDMRWCTPEELEELWVGARLHDVNVDQLVVAASYEDFSDFWAPFPSGIGPAGTYCASLAPDRQDVLRLSVFRKLGSPDGPFDLTARAWVAVGQVD